MNWKKNPHTSELPQEPPFGFGHLITWEAQRSQRGICAVRVVKCWHRLPWEVECPSMKTPSWTQFWATGSGWASSGEEDGVKASRGACQQHWRSNVLWLSGFPQLTRRQPALEQEKTCATGIESYYNRAELPGGWASPSCHVFWSSRLCDPSRRETTTSLSEFIRGVTCKKLKFEWKVKGKKWQKSKCSLLALAAGSGWKLVLWAHQLVISVPAFSPDSWYQAHGLMC